jgi:endogenous inhibitor of DNA gyrase (YacG/DUF329 family)
MAEKMEVYCVKCKAKKSITEYKVVTTKNKRKMAKGKCPTCGTGVNKFLAK